MAAVYKIVNLLNKKKYYGSASWLASRIGAHKCTLRSNTHYNEHLQRAWNKYGEENFKFKVIKNYLTLEKARKLEQYFINKYETYRPEIGYNKCKIVSRGASRLGSFNGMAVLTEDSVLEIVDLLNKRVMLKDIAKKFKVGSSTISLIKYKVNWKYITKDLYIDTTHGNKRQKYVH